MQHVDLSIILVNWNTRDLLRACLLSLRKHPPAKRALEIVLVDDASTDGSVEMVEAEFPHVRVLRNREKQGFTRANNRGLAAARGDLLLCLNTDTEVHAGALDRLCDLAASRPDLGICSAMLLNTDGTHQGHCRAFDTLLSVVVLEWCLYRIPALRSRVRGYRGEEPAPFPCADPACPHQIVYHEFLAGACHLLRREVYERIGPQDESFPIWTGDMDWCLTAHKAGYRQAVLTCARITHHEGGTTRKDDTRRGDNRVKVWGMYHGWVNFFRKHYGPASVLAVKLVLGLRCAYRIGIMLPLIALPPLHARARMTAAKYWGALCRLPCF
jgi:GT2 family glycosyltransferase